MALAPLTASILPPLPAVADNAAMEDEPPKRKRRWFRFSLRTMLIAVTLLAVACAYVAHEHSIVEARDEARPRVVDPFFDPFANSNKPDKSKQISERNPAADPSFVRRWLGDSAEETLDAYSDEQAEKFKSLFPEAAVWRRYGPEPK